jgi:propionate CoA-transferase
LEKRFLATGSPRGITYVFSAGQGDRGPRGLNQLTHEGLLKRTIGAHYAVTPEVGRLANEEKIEAFNLPQGVMSQLYRDMAAAKPGTITHVGLKTYMDPRLEGGKLNQRARDSGIDMVKVIAIEGKELLFYRAFPIDICVIRGTYADAKGNVTLEKEGLFLDATSMAQATRRWGGKVIVQVEQIVQSGSLNPKLVKIPGIYVDYIMPVGADNMPEYDVVISPSAAGLTRIATAAMPALELDQRKIIARRAALELRPDTVVNLGVGIPEAVSLVANEEGIGGYMTLTVESGPIGGISADKLLFGVSMNPDAILDQGYQFDFYDGGGLDLAYLGAGQVDKEGNVNVSHLGAFVTGCGGFINITQNAKKLFFCGSMTAKGLKIKTGDGKLAIVNEGRERKFIDKVRQVTFSGEYAVSVGQPTMYITERAVFELRSDGLHLTEVAPGIDVEKDILAHMDFKPHVQTPLKLMDARIFRDAPMNLKQQ